jgi:hypothetical protein
MDDHQLSERIDQLVEEERRLWHLEERREAGDDDRRRLGEVKVALDRCWDLLRQRRALEEFGLDPEGAHARSENVVEHYQQ